MRRRRGSRGALVLDRGAERGEVVVRPALGGEPREHGLEMEAGLEALENSVEPEVGDEEAAIHLELDEPVAGEPPQRLADGAAGDPERVGELSLPDPRARSDASVDDHRAELVVGETDDRAHAERAGCRPHQRLTWKVDIRCSNVVYRSGPAQGAPGSWRRNG